MAVTDFETELNLGTLATGTLRGGITRVSVKEKDANNIYQPTHIVRSDRDWQIKMKWELVGTMLDSPFFTIPGKWLVKAYLEGWGENADEKDLNGDHAGGLSVIDNRTIVRAGSLGPNNPVETEWRYSDTITINAGVVKPGPYRLAVTLTYEDGTGTPGPMAGFIEVRDMIQIYKPG